MKHRRQPIERLESRLLLSVSLVKDLNTSELGTNGPLQSVLDIEPAGSFSYLAAWDTTTGIELYRTDGTAAGTTLVKDVRPGRDNSQAGWLTHMGGGILLFSADDGVNGFELWRSDGTEAGTYLVKDINPGSASSSPGNLVNINGTLYFTATTAASGTELWKSDGTEAGTVQVKDIYAGATGSVPTQLINNNGTLFFRATTSASGAELWKSNGTDAGTVQVKELYNNNNNGMQNQPMAVLNGYVYFAGITSTGGTDLWRSDGTDVGTTMVADVSSTSSSVLSGIKASGNLIYYLNSSNTGLWRTDSVNPPVQIVNQIPIAQIDVNGTLVYGLSGSIYATTGGAPTTLKSGLTFRSFSGQYWAAVNGVVYLPADDGLGFGDELWRSDGTALGTYMLKDINPGSANGSPGFFAQTSGSNFLFVAGRADVGLELFKSDGTDPGTQLVKNISTATASSGPIQLTPFNGKLYFEAFVPGFGETGGELYSSDGTAAGTDIVLDIMPGATGSSITSLKVWGSYLYFAANNGTNGKELWRTDGTPGGTVMVADINAGSASSNPAEFTPSGSYLYFTATTAANGEELWRIDAAGNLVRLTDINPGTGSSSVDIWGESNGTVYFTANNNIGFAGLFKSNGTTATTTGLTSTSGAFTGMNSSLNVGGWLYLAGTTSATGTELFKTFGGGSPVLVKDIAAGSSSSSPQNLTDVDGTIFFSAISTSSIGRELWKTDGTDPGTVLVKDIASTSFESSNPQNMVAAAGILYFNATLSTSGAELWRSDGTAAGTYLLKDIWTGTVPGSFPVTQQSGAPSRLAAFGGYVYFAAEDGINGREVWRTDGTPDGTILYADLYPENSLILVPALPAFFTAVGNTLFFRDTDDNAGDELWKITPDFATLGGGGALTVGATAGNDVINISSAGGAVTITLNGITQSFGPGAVSSIQLLTKGGTDTINVNSGAHTFSTDIRDSFGAKITLNIANGAGVVFNATQHLAALNLVGNATASMAANGNRTLFADGLTLSGSSNLDLADNDLVVNNGAFATIQSLVFGGFGNTTGITTSTSDGNEILALFDNAMIGATDWNGEPIGANAIVGKYTYFGDVNFDGQVTGDDYTIIDSNLNTTPPSGLAWLSGDANLDGVVTGDDYTTIDSNLGLGVGNPLAPSTLRARDEDRAAALLR